MFILCNKYTKQKDFKKWKSFFGLKNIYIKKDNNNK